MSDTTSRHDHDDRSGTAYIEGIGEMVIEFQDYGSFDYNVQTAPGFPAGSNSQDNDEINLRIERIEGGRGRFNRSRIDIMLATIRWNVTVPYIITYIVE